MGRSNWLLCFFSVLVLFATGSLICTAEVPNLSITIPTIDAPEIDGDLTDSGWLKASSLGSKIVVDLANSVDSLSEYPRITYVGYDDQNLYLAFVVFTPDTSLLVADAAKWWNCDEVEVFIDPAKSGSLVQLGFTAGGEASDSSVKYAINKDNVRWTGEIAIPFTLLGVTPKQGDVWGINICGHQIAVGDMWLAWNAPYGAFKNATRMGNLVFGE